MRFPRPRPEPARRPSSRLVWVLVGGLLAMAISACGIPTDVPEALPQEDHEDILFGTSTTTTPPALSDTVDITLFFISTEDKLESVIRPYEASPTYNQVLRDLESPPRAEEQALFQDRNLLLRSAVLPGLEATLQGDEGDNARGYRTLAVNPAAELRENLDTNPPQARLAVSQLVCTFLSLPGIEGNVTGVELVDDREEPIPLIDSASQLIDGRPATKDDFGGCKTGTEQLNEALESESGSTTTEAATSSTDAQN